MKIGQLLVLISDLLISIGNIKNSGFIKLSSNDHHSNWQAIPEACVDCQSWVTCDVEGLLTFAKLKTAGRLLAGST